MRKSQIRTTVVDSYSIPTQLHQARSTQGVRDAAMAVLVARRNLFWGNDS